MIVLYYFVIINIISFLLYGIDKIKAFLKKWRISEKTLFFLSLIGGSIGCLIGMLVFRHKINKKIFWLWNIVLLIIWLYIGGVFLWK